MEHEIVREATERILELRRKDFSAYLAVICKIEALLIHEGKTTVEEAALNKDIANASKGELKRAIKCLRECASIDPQVRESTERTIQFIRRELLHKEDKT